MKNIEGKFLERVERTATITSFRFDIGEKPEFIPGQHMEVIFDENNRDLRHILSFSSSPDRDYIEFTKRLSESPFSGRLRDLKSGDKVLFRLPMGDCVLKENYKNLAFLIGGIGITPVASMLDYITDRGLDIKAALIYSNRSIDEIAFKERFDSLKEKDNIDIIYAVTDQTVEREGYYNGRINKELVKKSIFDIEERVFYIYGPPKMVTAMKALLLELGLSDDNIKTESFWGY